MNAPMVDDDDEELLLLRIKALKSTPRVNISVQFASDSDSDAASSPIVKKSTQHAKKKKHANDRHERSSANSSTKDEGDKSNVPNGKNGDGAVDRAVDDANNEDDDDDEESQLRQLALKSLRRSSSSTQSSSNVVVLKHNNDKQTTIQISQNVTPSEGSVSVQGVIISGNVMNGMSNQESSVIQHDLISSTSEDHGQVLRNQSASTISSSEPNGRVEHPVDIDFNICCRSDVSTTDNVRIVKLVDEQSGDKGEVQSEVKSEVQNEVYDEKQNDVQNDIQNEVQNEVRDDERSEVNNEVKSESRSKVQSKVEIEVKGEIQNEVQSEVQNDEQDEKSKEQNPTKKSNAAEETLTKASLKDIANKKEKDWIGNAKEMFKPEETLDGEKHDVETNNSDQSIPLNKSHESMKSEDLENQISPLVLAAYSPSSPSDTDDDDDDDDGDGDGSKDKQKHNVDNTITHQKNSDEMFNDDAVSLCASDKDDTVLGTISPPIQKEKQNKVLSKREVKTKCPKVETTLDPISPWNQKEKTSDIIPKGKSKTKKSDVVVESKPESGLPRNVSDDCGLNVVLDRYLDEVAANKKLAMSRKSIFPSAENVSKETLSTTSGGDVDAKPGPSGYIPPIIIHGYSSDSDDSVVVNDKDGDSANVLITDVSVKGTLGEQNLEDAEKQDDSKDVMCPICLGDFENRSFLNACFHSFCYMCIVQWSEISRSCPLCKTKYMSLIHSVNTDLDYETFEFPELQPEKEIMPLRREFSETMDDGRFRYRSTMVDHDEWNARRAERERIEQEYIASRQKRRMKRRLKWSATKDVRRNVYNKGLQVKEVKQRGVPKCRDISPKFFHDNPALKHRLVPWLLRDLGILLGGDDENVRFVMTLIMNMISKVSMDDDSFKEQLTPFLFDQTSHFIDELISFASSPYDIRGYDKNVKYGQGDDDVKITFTAHPAIHISDSESVNDTTNPNRQPVVGEVFQNIAAHSNNVEDTSHSGDSKIIPDKGYDENSVSISVSDDDEEEEEEEGERKEKKGNKNESDDEENKNDSEDESEGEESSSHNDDVRKQKKKRKKEVKKDRKKNKKRKRKRLDSDVSTPHKKKRNKGANGKSKKGKKKKEGDIDTEDEGITTHDPSSNDFMLRKDDESTGVADTSSGKGVADALCKKNDDSNSHKEKRKTNVDKEKKTKLKQKKKYKREKFVKRKRKHLKSSSNDDDDDEDEDEVENPSPETRRKNTRKRKSVLDNADSVRNRKSLKNGISKTSKEKTSKRTLKRKSSPDDSSTEDETPIKRKKKDNPTLRLRGDVKDKKKEKKMKKTKHKHKKRNTKDSADTNSPNNKKSDTELRSKIDHAINSLIETKASHNSSDEDDDEFLKSQEVQDLLTKYKYNGQLGLIKDGGAYKTRAQVVEELLLIEKAITRRKEKKKLKQKAKSSMKSPTKGEQRKLQSNKHSGDVGEASTEKSRDKASKRAERDKSYKTLFKELQEIEGRINSCRSSLQGKPMELLDGGK